MNKPVSLATVPLSRFHNIDTGSNLVATRRPRDEFVRADAEVLAAYADFSQQTPLVVSTTTSIEAARRWMKQARARLLMVVDPLETLLGIVSLADLFSGRAALGTEGGSGKATVLDVMTPKSQLCGIPSAALARATADDLRKTLDVTQQPWLLVVDIDRHAVCGLVMRDALDAPPSIELPPHARPLWGLSPLPLPG